MAMAFDYYEKEKRHLSHNLLENSSEQKIKKYCTKIVDAFLFLVPMQKDLFSNF